MLYRWEEQRELKAKLGITKIGKTSTVLARIPSILYDRKTYVRQSKEQKWEQQRADLLTAAAAARSKERVLYSQLCIADCRTALVEGTRQDLLCWGIWEDL